MNIAQIRNYDVANGEGIRVSLFTYGCYHNCYNCFNKEYQSFNYGNKWTSKNHIDLQELLNNPKIRGLSLLGGEPMEYPKELLQIINNLHLRDNQDIWMWSGYTLEEIILDKDRLELLKCIDVLVDGLYVEKFKDLSLKFRGSSNQRIIDIQKTLENKKIILYYKEEV